MSTSLSAYKEPLLLKESQDSLYMSVPIEVRKKEGFFVLPDTIIFNAILPFLNNKEKICFSVVSKNAYRMYYKSREKSIPESISEIYKKYLPEAIRPYYIQKFESLVRSDLQLAKRMHEIRLRHTGAKIDYQTVDSNTDPIVVDIQKISFIVKQLRVDEKGVSSKGLRQDVFSGAIFREEDFTTTSFACALFGIAAGCVGPCAAAGIFACSTASIAGGAGGAGGGCILPQAYKACCTTRPKTSAIERLKRIRNLEDIKP